MSNDANVIFHTATNLDSIEIQDGSTATVTLGFSLENIILTSGSLDLTVNDQKPCTGKLEVAKDTKYTLKSASGFDMTIISPAEKEYVLTTDHTEVTSKEVEQLINMTEQLASVSKSEDANFTQDIYTRHLSEIIL